MPANNSLIIISILLPAFVGAGEVINGAARQAYYYYFYVISFLVPKYQNIAMNFNFFLHWIQVL